MVKRLPRLHKEGRGGVIWFLDLSSFFRFEKIEQLTEYNYMMSVEKTS
jgi:hypothetical protein